MGQTLQFYGFFILSALGHSLRIYSAPFRPLSGVGPIGAKFLRRSERSEVPIADIQEFGSNQEKNPGIRPGVLLSDRCRTRLIFRKHRSLIKFISEPRSMTANRKTASQRSLRYPISVLVMVTSGCAQIHIAPNSNIRTRPPCGGH